MLRICTAVVMAAVWLSPLSTAQADSGTPVDATPGPQPTSPPLIVQSTPVPVVGTTAPVTEPQPTSAAEIGSSSVSPENHPIVHATEPAIAAPTEAPLARSEVPGVTNLNATTPGQVHSRSSKSGSTSGTAGPSTSTIPGNPAVSGATTLPPFYTGATSASFAAPAQLACHGSKKGIAAPFLSSPYSGWADINSFVDHDKPDYEVDGRIVIANGLSADSSSGQADAYFPAYWSDALRQYINYDGHNGYDFGISYQPVLAAAGGTIEYAGWNGESPYEGYGQMVLINHHNGYVTLYGHLSKLEVQTGDTVRAGEEIGISGNTGNSSGPHLHFSVFHNCQVTDPYGWTGSGHDPLADFNNETASYLWLPGQDPLVLNPPPHWPSFPLDLRLPDGSTVTAEERVARTVPPANRLLLLRLPQTEPGRPALPAVALAQTEAQVTQEAQALAPYLDDLRREGLVQRYELIPAAGAVWVRSSAAAPLLEILPGVASLAGASSGDLRAAQAGLAHSVLVQMAAQEAPSLWPAGFRASMHTWRPLLAIATGHALIAGFALPGTMAVVTLYSGRRIIGVGDAVTDPVDGGFVTMLHGANGSPAPAQAGETIEVRCGNRVVRLDVPAFSVRVRSNSVSGHGPKSAPLALALVSGSARDGSRTATSDDAHGRFSVHAPDRLPPGTLAIASTVDAAGNQEAASGIVPGVSLTEGASMVHGWTVGLDPHLSVSRSGRVIFDTRLQPASDGSFQIRLQNGAQPLALDAGDTVSIGSRWHTRHIILPRLSVRVTPRSRRLTVTGPPRAELTVTERSAGGARHSAELTLPGGGEGSLAWPWGGIRTGDAADAHLRLATGDSIDAAGEVDTLTLHEGDSLLAGTAPPGSTVTAHVLSPKGGEVGSALGSVAGGSGAFLLSLHDVLGDPVQVSGGQRISLEDAGSTWNLTAPYVRARYDYAVGVVLVKPPTAATVTARLLQGRRTKSISLRTGSLGRLVATVGRFPARQRAYLDLHVSLRGGISVERYLRLAPPPRHAKRR